MQIDLTRFGHLISEAEQTVLTGDAEDSFKNYEKGVPVNSTFKVSSKFEYETGEMSLTVIRIKTNE